MLTWLKQRLNRTRNPVPLVLVGIGYSSHQLWQALEPLQQFALIACIDDEPWNHRTLFQGARVHYPSELIALIKKHKVRCVVDFEDEAPALPTELITELATLTYLRFNPQQESLDHQIQALRQSQTD